MAFEMDRQGLIALLQELIKPQDGKPPVDKAFKNIEASIDFAGKKIILPADPRHMTLPEAREWLQRLETQDNENIGINEVIDAHPWDGCVAFMIAMKETYGWAQPVPPRGWWPQPPVMVAIETGPDETATIFWGGFRLPGIEGQLQTGMEEKKGKVRFVINGTVKRKYVEVVHTLAELTRTIVRERSIYRGHALRLAVNEQTGAIDLTEAPTFMNLKRVRENELVFSDDLMEQVNTNLWTPIEQTEWCRMHDVPLKRGVLLEGPYGTGKTLAATITAKKCEANGWTFVTVSRVTALEPALQFALGYQPCVVFVEDIDRELAGERTPEMDDILNKVDGIVSKNSEVMVVLTSNRAHEINRAMLRPGRLDAVLHIGPPDAGAVQKLLRVYGRKLIKKDEDLTSSGEVLAGRIPAVIREVVERSKLYAIARAPGAEFFLTDADIVRSARGMEHHLRLLDGAPPVVETAAEQLATLLGAVLNHHLANGGNEGLSKTVKEITTELADLKEKMHQIHEHFFG